MKDLVNEIKYNRKFHTLNNILDNCFKFDVKSDSYNHKIAGGVVLLFNLKYGIFEYNMFIVLGMDISITHDELKEFINERFGKQN